MSTKLIGSLIAGCSEIVFYSPVLKCLLHSFSPTISNSLKTIQKQLSAVKQNTFFRKRFS